MKYSHYSEVKGHYLYRIKGLSNCIQCKHYGKCTDNTKGRSIIRLKDEHIKKELEALYRSDKGQVIYKKRKAKAECTKAGYRTISLDPREYLMQRMRIKLDTKEGRIKYGKRKYIVEPVFGDMKYNRKMRELLLRGKLKAKGEFLIMCIAHYLKKIAKYLAGSRNPALCPAGA